jgi:adenylyl-sulfate kinase
MHAIVRREIFREVLHVCKAQRSRIKQQKPTIVWLTGLSASGKSTIAKRLESDLHRRGYHTYVLDGDNLRFGLNQDLGFSDADRVENIRRVGEVGKLFLDAGLIVICAFISPFRDERQQLRDSVEEDEFIEVFVDAPIETCRQRDPKGLYAKASAGLIKNFTGIDSPYEKPERPDLHLRSGTAEASEHARSIINELERRGRITSASAGRVRSWQAVAPVPGTFRRKAARLAKSIGVLVACFPLVIFADGALSGTPLSNLFIDDAQSLQALVPACTTESDLTPQNEAQVPSMTLEFRPTVAVTSVIRPVPFSISSIRP